MRLPRFPATRYQGSKRRLLGRLHACLATLDFATALDLYSGTGSVSLLLRWMGKRVTANDYLRYNALTAQLLLNATPALLRPRDAAATLRALLHDRSAAHGTLVRDHYAGVFFTDAENTEIDTFAQNVATVAEPARSLYIHAVGQALLKKRPYNLFHRANLQMRLRQVPRGFGNAATWEASIADHAAKAIRELQAFPFDGLPAGEAGRHDARMLPQFADHHELVYLDPPYLNARAEATDYGDLYGFLDGLCDYALFAAGDRRYAHRPLPAGTAGWDTPAAACQELQRIAERWPQALLLLSYRSDGQPSLQALAETLRAAGRTVTVDPGDACKYVLSRAAGSRECLLLAGSRKLRHGR